MFHWDTIGERWDEARERMRETWVDLEDDEIVQLRGEREQIVALLMRKYGKSRAEAEQDADEWAAFIHDALSTR